jgi:hypothetical protein
VESTRNGTFSVDSLYKAILQSDIPVDNNKKIWKMKIPLKNKKIGWYLRRGVILTKDNLVKRSWHGNTRCVFCHQDETIKHLFFQCRFARSIWSIIQVASSLYPPTSVTNIFGNWLHGIDLRFRMLIRWVRRELSGCYGCVEMTRSLTINIVLSCRLSTDVLVFSVCGHHFSGWRIVAGLWRSVHGWKSRRGILFPYMGGCIIYGLELHPLLRRSTITQYDMHFAFFG